MKKLIMGVSMVAMMMVMAACGASESVATVEESSTVESTIAETTVDNDNAESNDSEEQQDIESVDVELKEAIIYHDESAKLDTLPDRTPESIATLETVPDSSITYVSVGGYGNACGMGVPFQQYSVGVRANPIEGYRYAGCESNTIEFFEYVPNESLGYDVPWFYVPDSGNHVIYVYYEPVE